MKLGHADDREYAHVAFYSPWTLLLNLKIVQTLSAQLMRTHLTALLYMVKDR
jgi:hypothetical protein